MSNDPYVRVRNLLKKSPRSSPQTPPKPPPVPPKDIPSPNPRRPSDEDVTKALNSMSLGSPPKFPMPESNPSSDAFIGGFAPQLPHTRRQQSLTMQMALNGDIAGGAPYQRPTRDTEAYNLLTTLPADTRLHSESHLPITAAAAPPPLVTTPTKPRHRRANSTPPTSPTKQTSVTPKKGKGANTGEPMQCNGVTKAGKRCTRQVKGAEGDAERFCHQHQKELLTPSGFYARKTGAWVNFADWIPEYLEATTKVALRVEMDRARSTSDEDGYIYTFEIRDPSKPNILQLKVGRAVNLVKRIDQWGKQCGSKEQVLRGWYPGTVDPSASDDKGLDGTSLMKGRVQAGAKGPLCHRLERLVHLELGDLTRTKVYLQEDWPTSTPPPTLSTAGSLPAPSSTCPDCGQTHKEIFTFTRVEEGEYVGKEWEKIVQPVIEKWGAFVEAYV